MDNKETYEQVSKHYSAASQGKSEKYGAAVAKSFGYSEEELAAIPEGSNLGLSCGNPLAISSIREGETVIDLGSGAGFDVFLAASRVGATGRVIGVDMNKDMLARANKIKAQTGRTNVEFVESGITDMAALDAGIADCIISNCVINLVPETDKPLVFAEMSRLLKPGGRIAVSDILAKKELPQKLKSDLAMYVGCIAGASMVADYERYLSDAGFGDVLIANTNSNLNVYVQTDEDGSTKANSCNAETQPKSTSASGAAGCCGVQEGKTPGNIADTDLNEWVGSFKIYAVKN